MVSLVDKKITLQGQSYDIVSFAVWFKTPYGIVDNLGEALQTLSFKDMDPDLVIVPVPVALGPNGIYEVMV